jgi:hypothetical protein
MSEQTTLAANAPAKVTVPREITLDAIKSMSSDELRKIIRANGASAVNSRICGRS